MAVTWISVLENVKTSLEVDMDGEELTTGLVLLLVVLAKEMDSWEEVDWVEVNGEVNGGKGEVISLVFESHLDVETFLHHEWMGNSKGVTLSLSLCNRVNTPVSRNKEVTLSPEALGFSGFSEEMDICSNFYIKKPTLGDSRV